MEEDLEGRFISSSLEGNPFASLFPSMEVAVAYRESQARLEREAPSELMVIETEEQILPKDTISSISDAKVKHTQDLNSIIEEVFLVTLNKYSVVGGPQQQLVHLNSLAEVIFQCHAYLQLLLNQGVGCSHPAVARPPNPRAGHL